MRRRFCSIALFKPPIGTRCLDVPLALDDVNTDVVYT
jgi:hypothetical protein